MPASDAIAQIRRALAPLVSHGTLPGYVAAVSVHGESALRADGTLAIGDPRPMSAGTSFRVASLSKLVGAALTLTLVADGAVTLDAAVARWLPELAEPRVLRRPDGPLQDTVAANRPIVVEDLLKLTCGFGLVLARGPLVDAIKRDSLMPGPFSPPFSADEFMRRLGALPLAAQPGGGWLYHTGFDALAVLLARATGRPCSELLAERITGPLRMRGTGATAYIDPRRRLAAVLLTQRMMETSRPPAFMQRFWEAVYQGV